MQAKKPSALSLIGRYVMAANFLVLALIFYRNIDGNNLEGGINQFGALAMFLMYVAGVVYLVTGNPGIFHGDGMDVIVVCLFTLGISIWTLVRGAGFLFSGGLSGSLDFPALVDLYQFPGALLGMWTSWYIFKTAFGIELKKKS